MANGEREIKVNAVQTTKVLFTARTNYGIDEIAQKDKRKTYGTLKL